MKEFLISIAWRAGDFCLGVFIVCLLTATFPHVKGIILETNYNSVAFLTECTAQNDVEPLNGLILGSSIGQRGIDPEAFKSNGLNAFNLCSNGQSTINSALLLDWAISTGIQPRVVLLDLYPGIGKSTGIEAARGMACSAQSPLIGPGIQTSIATADPYSAILWLATSSQNLYNEPRAIDLGSDEIQPGGFIAAHRRPNPDVPFPCTEKFEPRSLKQRWALHHIQSTCSDNQIKLIIINPPQLCEEQFHHPDLFKETVWLNGNEWPESKTPTLYYDDHHLLAEGARKYSRWLSAQLTSILDPTDVILQR